MIRYFLFQWVFLICIANANFGEATRVQTVMFNAIQSPIGAQPGGSLLHNTIVSTASANAGRRDLASTTTPPRPTGTGDLCLEDCSINFDYVWISKHSWTKCEGTALIGVIHYIVDSANNKTTTSTSYSQQVTFYDGHDVVTSNVSNILAAGSQILVRTDVNAAGTVTYVDQGNTVAYPTAFNILPSLYAWNGTLRYTTDGTIACSTESDQLHATPLPSNPGLHAYSVYDKDQQDPRGWTYCYFLHEGVPWVEGLASVYSGDFLGQMFNQCSTSLWGAPASPVAVASFLLDQTTTYLDNTKTTHSETLDAPSALSAPPSLTPSSTPDPSGAGPSQGLKDNRVAVALAIVVLILSLDKL